MPKSEMWPQIFIAWPPVLPHLGPLLLVNSFSCLFTFLPVYLVELCWWKTNKKPWKKKTQTPTTTFYHHCSLCFGGGNVCYLVCERFSFFDGLGHVRPSQNDGGNFGCFKANMYVYICDCPEWAQPFFCTLLRKDKPNRSGQGKNARQSHAEKRELLYPSGCSLGRSMYFCFSRTQVLRVFPPPQETTKAKASEMTGCLWPASGYSAVKAAGRILRRGYEHPQRVSRPGEPGKTCDGLLKSDVPLIRGRGRGLGQVCVPLKFSWSCCFGFSCFLFARFFFFFLEFKALGLLVHS